MEIQIIMIHFSSVEISINFLLVFSLLGSWFGRWLFIIWGKGAFWWGIILKVIIIDVRGSFSDKGSLPGGGGQFNKSYENSTK